MKVVLVKAHAKQQGGLEKTTSRIAHAFLETGADVSMVTTEGQSIALDNLKVHPLPTGWRPGFLRLRQFDKLVSRWLQDHPADVVLGFDRTREQTHIRAGNGVHRAFLESRRRSEGAFKYATCWINPLHQTILRLEKQAFEHSGLRKIFTNSHMVKREILHYFSVDPSKICVIHNGVEWDEMAHDFAAWPSQKIARCQEYGLDPNRFHLLFIGNGYQRKGLAVLLEALAELKRPEVHLSVVGKDRHEAHYVAQAQALGIASQVRFFGSQPKATPFYQLADALAIPSFYDPFANVTVEALAMGLFVVSSKSNGGSEVLTHTTGSVIEDLHSVDSITSSLEMALRHPKTEASSEKIRASVKSLAYQQQLKQLVELCLA